MIYYIKFGSLAETSQFTNALEAKEAIETGFGEGENQVQFTFTEEPVEDVKELGFVTFNDKSSVRDAIDSVKDQNEEIEVTPESEGSPPE